MIRNFVDGDIVTSGEHFAKGKEATRQSVIRRLRLFLGEFFLDATDGTPWFQNILGKTDQDFAEAALKRRIITTPGVVGISSFSLAIEQRERRVVVQAEVIDVNNEQIAISLDERII